MALIALIGHKRAGKSYTARIINILTNNKYTERSFAYDLKKIASILTGIDAQTEEFKKSYLRDWKLTGRKFLQKLGTEVVRRFNRDTWVISLMRKYDKEIESNPNTNWIITDCRFINEVKAVKERKGIIIRIIRPYLEPKRNLINWFKRLLHIGEQFHRSEISLDKYETDYTIIANNSVELNKEVRKLVKKLKL